MTERTFGLVQLYQGLATLQSNKSGHSYSKNVISVVEVMAGESLIKNSNAEAVIPYQRLKRAQLYCE